MHSQLLKTPDMLFCLRLTDMMHDGAGYKGTVFQRKMFPYKRFGLISDMRRPMNRDGEDRQYSTGSPHQSSEIKDL